MDSETTPIKLILFHVRKTGGSSMLEALRKVVSVAWGPLEKIDRTRTFLSGHWYPRHYEQVFGWPENHRRFTVVREIGDWWLSEYYWQLRYKRQEGLNAVRQRWMDAARKGPQNFLDQMVKDKWLIGYLGGYTDKLHHIGDFSNLHNTVAWLQGELEMDLELGNENANPDKDPPLEDEEWFKEEVRRKCPEDCAFYEALVQPH